MTQSLGVQAVADPGLTQRFDGAVLEDTGAYAMLDVVPIAPLEDDRVDALQVQQLGQQQSCGSGADYCDLRTQLPSFQQRLAQRPTCRSLHRSLTARECPS